MDGFIAFCGVLLAAAVAIAVPGLLSVAMVETLRRFAPDAFYALPIFKRAAVLAGLMFAAALIALDPGFKAFAVGRLFATQSVWTLSFWQLVGERLFSPQFAPVNLIEALGGEDPAYSILMVGAMGVLTVALLLPLRIWDRAQAIQVAACVLALFAWSSLLAVYVVFVTAWLLHTLNFWAFAIVGLLYQRWRNRRHVVPAG